MRRPVSRRVRCSTNSWPAGWIWDTGRPCPMRARTERTIRVATEEIRMIRVAFTATVLLALGCVDTSYACYADGQLRAPGERWVCSDGCNDCWCGPFNL